MLKIKEILSKFQEDTKFIEKVANSNTIDKLYEVFCEYEYNSDINSFESEIYELLSSSDLIKKSIDEEELEKISGGANMRKKIMSVIALSSLAIGGVASTSHVDAGNVPAQQTSRKYRDTILPSREWKTLGVGLFAVALGVGVGTYVYNQRKPAENTSTPQDEITFDTALEYIEKWHNGTQGAVDRFPTKIVKAVDKIEKTFFPDGKPEPITIPQDAYLKSGSPTQTSLKNFPTCKNDCQQEEYFKPLSYKDGKGEYDPNDTYTLHKCLFQYLCRLLCFVNGTENLVKSKHITMHDGRFADYCYEPSQFRNILLGYVMPYPYQTRSGCYSDYSEFFKVAYDDSKKSNGADSPVTQLIGTVMSMYLGNLPERNEYRQGHPKIGVLCGNKPRDIDN